MNRMTRFAAVGAVGALVNLLVMALLVHGVVSLNYIAAAVIAAQISILHNFLLHERFVFGDVRDGARSRPGRLTQTLVFNNAEALVRLPLLILVAAIHIGALLGQVMKLTTAFIARFLFVSKVVYRTKPAVRHTGSENEGEAVSA